MSKIYVSLGRAGDLISQLSLFRSESQRTGERVKVMVAKEFSAVLNGCSYIEPIVYDGSFLELEKAVSVACTLSDEVVVLSIHGSTDAVKELAYKQIGAEHRMTTSFQLEPWKLAGRLNDFYEDLPLVFDRRDSVREDRLLRANGFKNKGKRKPVMLLALGGVNCPFPHAELLRELVTAKFDDDYRIIDLPMVEQPDGRIYDLLAIYENSVLLITTDSMPLHLAWACRKLPVFALTNDRDPKGKRSLWHGSVWRPNYLWFCRYGNWPERAVEMCAAIHALPVIKYDRETVNVWVGKRDKELPLHPFISLPIMNGMCSRYSDGFPFLRDVIRMGIQRTNDTLNIIRNNVTMEGQWEGAYFSYRTQNGQHVPIVDLFSAPKAFWKKILPEIPDLVLDNEDSTWSQALWAIFRKHNATDATGCCEFVGGEK